MNRCGLVEYTTFVRKALSVHVRKVPRMSLKNKMRFSTALSRLAEVDVTNVNNKCESWNVPYAEHIFPEMTSIHVSPGIKSISEFYGQGLFIFSPYTYRAILHSPLIYFRLLQAQTCCCKEQKQFYSVRSYLLFNEVKYHVVRWIFRDKIEHFTYLAMI
jgi:hypothetical protein